MTIVTSSLLRSQSKHFFNSQTIPISNRIKTASIEKNLCHDTLPPYIFFMKLYWYLLTRSYTLVMSLKLQGAVRQFNT